MSNQILSKDIKKTLETWFKINHSSKCENCGCNKGIMSVWGCNGKEAILCHECFRLYIEHKRKILKEILKEESEPF